MWTYYSDWPTPARDERIATYAEGDPQLLFSKQDDPDDLKSRRIYVEGRRVSRHATRNLGLDTFAAAHYMGRIWVFWQRLTPTRYRELPMLYAAEGDGRDRWRDLGPVDGDAGDRDGRVDSAVGWRVAAAGGARSLNVFYTQREAGGRESVRHAFRQGPNSPTLFRYETLPALTGRTTHSLTALTLPDQSISVLFAGMHGNYAPPPHISVEAGTWTFERWTLAVHADDPPTNLAAVAWNGELHLFYTTALGAPDGRRAVHHAHRTPTGWVHEPWLLARELDDPGEPGDPDGYGAGLAAVADEEQILVFAGGSNSVLWCAAFRPGIPPEVFPVDGHVDDPQTGTTRTHTATRGTDMKVLARRVMDSRYGPTVPGVEVRYTMVPRGGVPTRFSAFSKIQPPVTINRFIASPHWWFVPPSILADWTSRTSHPVYLSLRVSYKDGPAQAIATRSDPFALDSSIDNVWDRMRVSANPGQATRLIWMGDTAGGGRHIANGEYTFSLEIADDMGVRSTSASSCIINWHNGRIECVVRPNSEADEAGLIAFGGRNAQGFRWTATKPGMVSAILDGQRFFVQAENGARADVEVVTPAEGDPYIRTTADATSNNNLLSLPNCSPA
ncbi:DUF3892 domain-containing protein [Microbacterium sp. BK668]|uniref:DUF3892 domain-containing protein n=1 Tax=Microbacterium sp. BK668 TaxID=2512118 RepID=UPI0010CE5883|nr:DUF3892 domain-containing protein [Microbacterium sp. BK668]TDN91923.1 uncharacterized protein DUF3892 [Microbacterium sp. BK668]